MNFLLIFILIIYKIFFLKFISLIIYYEMVGSILGVYSYLEINLIV